MSLGTGMKLEVALSGGEEAVEVKHLRIDGGGQINGRRKPCFVLSALALETERRRAVIGGEEAAPSILPRLKPKTPSFECLVSDTKKLNAVIAPSGRTRGSLGDDPEVSIFLNSQVVSSSEKLEELLTKLLQSPVHVGGGRSQVSPQVVQCLRSQICTDDGSSLLRAALRRCPPLRAALDAVMTARNARDRSAGAASSQELEQLLFSSPREAALLLDAAHTLLTEPDTARGIPDWDASPNPGAGRAAIELLEVVLPSTLQDEDVEALRSALQAEAEVIEVRAFHSPLVGAHHSAASGHPLQIEAWSVSASGKENVRARGDVGRVLEIEEGSSEGAILNLLQFLSDECDIEVDWMRRYEQLLASSTDPIPVGPPDLAVLRADDDLRDLIEELNYKRDNLTLSMVYFVLLGGPPEEREQLRSTIKDQLQLPIETFSAVGSQDMDSKEEFRWICVPLLKMKQRQRRCEDAAGDRALPSTAP